eukprot:14397203-Heterocapsa_arctica.AAC.1
MPEGVADLLDEGHRLAGASDQPGGCQVQAETLLVLVLAVGEAERASHGLRGKKLVQVVEDLPHFAGDGDLTA